ncbi:hypothetical protein HA050_11720 [Iodobacter sp. HSC-16F04]|uniref:DUF2007 domain-containing protein n=1 Tax=Iodobacter violaceini TaxID=3044271 RepID=A0ABX0KQD6_9NEIS|nr:hypothetical protein [Iodobacter violacea]NHQ86786.1 hypothetical protein [Iodobacter violacea]
MSMMNNLQAMGIINDAAEKLRVMGLTCWMSPNDLGNFGMSVSLHVGETELATAAAHVAQRDGSTAPHLADDKVREQFAVNVADAELFKTSGQ